MHKEVPKCQIIALVISLGLLVALAGVHGEAREPSLNMVQVISSDIPGMKMQIAAVVENGEGEYVGLSVRPCSTSSWKDIKAFPLAKITSSGVQEISGKNQVSANVSGKRTGDHTIKVRWNATSLSSYDFCVRDLKVAVWDDIYKDPDKGKWCDYYGVCAGGRLDDSGWLDYEPAKTYWLNS